MALRVGEETQVSGVGLLLTPVGLRRTSGRSFPFRQPVRFLQRFRLRDSGLDELGEFVGHAASGSRSHALSVTQWAARVVTLQA
ncbi:MAG: hypothetical protein HW418_4287 [Anaerolineales bacterium]|nr:hypothetical protein [Anaerolineales bacterium]